MNKSFAASGNSGPRVRSDCEISLELKNEGGLIIDLVSKVKSLYGESITELVKEILAFYSVENAVVKINDSGALPFVLAARMESSIRKITGTQKEFLPEFLPCNNYNTKRDRFRFSRLYLPGNTPGLMINAGLHKADGIILDLEDSVAPDRKEEARILVRNALRQVDFCGSERMVRINQGERGLEDLAHVIPHNVNLVIIPKCEDSDYIREADEKISKIKLLKGIDSDVFLMPVIESAMGVERSYEIATSSKNIVAIAIGLEDYTADLGVSRTLAGSESFYARTRLIVAAKAAGIQPIDSVFSDVADMEALRINVIASKALGFEGMGCIHPRQVAIIKNGFYPDGDEIEKSKKIVLAFETARQKGLGVVSLGTKMIDQPVVLRAQRTLGLAINLGLIPADWNNSVE
jgi:citrate lyase subunit beta / citryl-CoA lyase